MPFNFGGGENRERSRHPDLDDNGELRADAFDDPRRREFNRMAADAARWEAFYGQVTRDQQQLPFEVQQAVAGIDYSPYGATPYDQYQAYLRDIQDQRASRRGVITGADVERMDLATYDALFDASGRPKPGVSYEANLSGRDVNLRQSVDPFSHQELRQGRES